MISLPRNAAAPAGPGSRDLISTALRITLRPSVAFFVILVGSLLIATAALWSTLAPWLGNGRALPATLAFAAALALGAIDWWRKQPSIIEIVADGICAYAHDGRRIACGPLTGCSQWGASLLVLSVGAARDRRVLLVAADAMSAASWRELAVRARPAAGH